MSDEGTPSKVSLAEENNHLKQLVEVLRARVRTLEKVVTQPELMEKPTTLSDGTVVSVNPDEVASMRAVFASLDSSGRGTISATELKALHERLGEPITDEEAAEAVKAMNVSGTVAFEDFMRWWDQEHAARDVHGRRGARYKSKFKFLKARMPTQEVARIRSRAGGAGFQYRVKFYYDNEGKETQVSPWHDIPLRNADGTYNFVCEIPKWTRAKMEIATGEAYNPIKQDTKNGTLRFYQWGDMLFNYGALPQTWEDPSHTHPDTGFPGDNDPIDAVEIGTKQWHTGAVVSVKVLGVLALVDAGETDWKLLVISTEDALAKLLHDIDDVEVNCPGLVDALREWLRFYKTAAGSSPNKFALGERCMDRAYAERVIQHTHESWQELIRSKRREV